MPPSASSLLAGGRIPQGRPEDAGHAAMHDGCVSGDVTAAMDPLDRAHCGCLAGGGGVPRRPLRFVPAGRPCPAGTGVGCADAVLPGWPALEPGPPPQAARASGGGHDPAGYGSGLSRPWPEGRASGSAIPRDIPAVAAFGLALRLRPSGTDTLGAILLSVLPGSATG
jgi:hypothetical protein